MNAIGTQLRDLIKARDSSDGGWLYHQIQSECRELAGGRGMGQPNLSRETKFLGTNGGREMLIFPVQVTTSKIGNLTQLIHTLL